MRWLNLSGKTAIVTGGSAGIGKTVSLTLAEEGVSVAIADINGNAGKAVLGELKKKGGGNHIFEVLDVTSQKNVEAFVDKVVAAWGKIDILVNNAGILIPRLLVDPAGKQELTEEIWDKVVAVNQKGSFLCAQAVARHMLKAKRGGVIINMTSESGLEGSAGQSAYAATKAALYAMTRSWAKELGKHGIRVVGCAPGVLEPTALRSPEYEQAVAYTRGMTVEQFRAAYETGSIPLGRAGTLQEVADLVAFLASDRASYINGTVINISGGKSRG